MRPLDPADWPLTKPAPVPPLVERVAALREDTARYGPKARIGLMLNAADVEELMAALEARKEQP